MKIIKFLTSCSPYTTGEIAGFDEETADRLVKAGVAEPYPKEAPKAPVSPVAPAAPVKETKVIDPKPAVAPRPGTSKVAPVTKGA